MEAFKAPSSTSFIGRRSHRKILLRQLALKLVPATFRFESYSIKIVTSLFPDAYDKHFFHDYFCRQMDIRDGPSHE